MRRMFSVGLAGLCFSVTGCFSSFHEHHFFESLDANRRPVNYYRVDVDGSVLLSSSRYISGYFDEQAVETYFNEYTQPANGQLLPQPADESTPARTPVPDATAPSTTSPSTTSANTIAPGTTDVSTTSPADGAATAAPSTEPGATTEPSPAGAGAGSAAAPPPAPLAPNSPRRTPRLKADERVVPLGSADEDRKLVLLLTSNSDDIATGISNLAQSDSVAETLKAIVSKGRLGREAQQSDAQAAAAAEVAALKSLGDATIAKLADDAAAGAAVPQILAYANRLASFLDPSHPTFTTLTDAKQWVESNRSRLEANR